MAFTGTKQPVALNTKDYAYGGLRLKLARNKASATHLIITLNSMDTYDMKFVRVRLTGSEYSETTVLEHNGVYDDMLASIFESETGLYTKF